VLYLHIKRGRWVRACDPDLPDDGVQEDDEMEVFDDDYVLKCHWTPQCTQSSKWNDRYNIHMFYLPLSICIVLSFSVHLFSITTSPPFHTSSPHLIYAPSLPSTTFVAGVLV
jgi:hypothetical protein